MKKVSSVIVIKGKTSKGPKQEVIQTKRRSNTEQENKAQKCTIGTSLRSDTFVERRTRLVGRGRSPFE